MKSEELRRYLDQVEGHLSGSRKSDILREIESHIWDRAEALAAARGAAGPEAPDLQRAMGELGDPSDLAVSYSGERHLVTPKEYAAFWYFTLLVFAVHVSMLLLAAVTKAQFGFFPFNVLPEARLEGAGAALVVVSLAIQAFLFDAGLVLVVFFLLRQTFRRVEMPNLTFRVESSMRPSLVRAIFAVVLAILLAVPSVRDTLFSVQSIRGPEGSRTENVCTLFLPGWSDVLPWILVFLGLAFVKDVLYALRRERPLTVGLDLLTAVAGTGLFVYLFSRKPFIGLPEDFPLAETTLDLFNEVLARLLGVAFIVLAAIFAVRAVRRFVRLRQIWGEREPEAL